ncbi:MAG TPA: hypothetical protein VM597_07650 [Gemmataceae bacterium]|nr:hypothetical protein [Gemmataceae bacterium]
MTADPPREARRGIRPRHAALLAPAILALIGGWWYWSGSPRTTLPVGVRAWAVAFSPDGTLLATGGAQTDGFQEANGVVRLWDVATRRPVATWVTNGHYVAHLAFGPDGRTLTSMASVGSYDPVSGVLPRCEIRVWDVATFQEIGGPTAADFPKPFPLISPTSRVVAESGGWGVVVLSDAEAGEEMYRVPADRRQLNCAAFSADGALLATGGGDTSGSGPSPIPWMNGDLRLWEVGTGRVLGTFNRHSAPIESVAFSPDGKLVASASLDGKVKLWAVPGR